MIMKTPSEPNYLITAALPYANNVPHIGNIIGSHLPADIFARFCRLKERTTLFVGGTDEHGTPNEVAAEKAGITPKELVDAFYIIHKQIYEWFGISYDNFSRTSNEIHHTTTQEFFQEIYKNGLISIEEIKLPYCEKDRRFLPDRFVEGQCPICSAEGARGDQCEKCGTILDAIELKNPYCIICKSKPVIKSTKHLFLDLQKVEKDLRKWVEESTQWKSQVKNLTIGWMKDGLKKRCISRDFKWGVKVPLNGFGDKVFYVWFDAPIGYISAVKEACEAKKEKIAGWWPEKTDYKKAKLFHFVGKDNIPFHTIFWPGMLIANKKFSLPFQIAGYQFMNFEGQKISKSRNWGVFCESLIKSGTPADFWRFYLAFKLPENSDSDFTWKEFESKINSELIGNFSNLVNRTLSFIKSKNSGVIPKPNKWAEEDKKLVELIAETEFNVGEAIDSLEIVRALQLIMELSAKTNAFFQQAEPWKNGGRRDNVLNLCANSLASLSILLQPFIPAACKRIQAMLNIANKNLKWQDAAKLQFKGGEEIGEIEILFQKLDEKRINELKEKTSKLGSVEEILGKHKQQKD